MTNTYIFSSRSHILLSVLNILLFVILTTGHTVSAQATEQPTPEQAVNYEVTESLGLLGAKNKNSFGNGVYRGTKRSELTALLKTTEQSNWVSMRPLVKSFLLTEADASALTQDIPIAAGEDLLTLRLNALLRMGYNREAFELYRKASDNKLDEPTIRAGIYAMLLNGQKGLACLDVKTVAPRFKDIHFWKTLSTYCESSLPGETASKQNKDIVQYPVLSALLKSPDYPYKYDPKSFTTLSMPERAALVAHNSITTSYISPQTISKIPPEHIAALLTQTHINDIQKALLLGAAIDYAIEPPEALTSFYKDLLIHHDKNNEDKGKNSNTNSLSSSQATDDLLVLARLYDEASGNWLPTGRVDKISQAIALARKYSDKLLIPFLPIISKLDINKDISIDDALAIAPLYLYTPDNISKKWVKDLLKVKLPDTLQEKITREKLIISLFLLYENTNDAFSDKVYKHISTNPLHTSIAKDIKNIIENIDSPPINSGKVRIEDVNGFDLVADKRYTMPPYRVSNALKKANDDQDISVSLLLSACILSKINRQDTYIGTLGDIASSLNNVGIKTAPRRIIAQALMPTEGKQKNEN